MKTPALPIAVFLMVTAVASSFSHAQGKKAEEWEQAFTGYEPLPPVRARAVVGEWNLGDECTGALISGNGKTYWASICSVRTGCCNGYSGLVLQASGPDTYQDLIRKTTYAIQPDGRLRITSPERQDETYRTQLDMDSPSWKNLSWQQDPPPAKLRRPPRSERPSGSQ